MLHSDFDTKRERKRVLVIGMLDSVHFARWLQQFEDQDIDFVIFSAKKFRRVCPLLKDVLKNGNLARYKISLWGSFFLFAGYLDFITFVLPQRILGLTARSKYLSSVLSKSHFDYIHALEIQGAGYLISSVNPNFYSKSKIIITNWGSDIYFYKDDPGHRILIERTLAVADFYSAECYRDYVLAREIGFTGIDLPCIPNAGGFSVSNELKTYPLTSERRQILVKGYGNTFGRADLVVKHLGYLMTKYPKYVFHFYSVTDDTLQLLNDLPDQLVSKVKITTVSNKLEHSEMVSEFGNSKIYIGCSSSDGISTSFLESLITGCYPIQTDTSCANEWVERGAIASIIPLDEEAILHEIERIILEVDYVDNAAKVNHTIAQDFLNKSVVKEQAIKFYA
jgi:glycosyltransferase involved in cell wall biosynthesis